MGRGGGVWTRWRPADIDFIHTCFVNRPEATGGAMMEGLKLTQLADYLGYLTPLGKVI